MLGSGSDPGLWERQLQQELLLIQKQQQIQKQLLISEFQKQHEKLTRQHQAQLQEHLKLQHDLQAMKQQQELAEKERRLEQQQSQQEKEQERNRREQHVSSLILRGKERSREGAVASTEVKQKLQEFLLSKSAKDPSGNGVNHSFIHQPKLWYMSSHHTSLDQSSPPLGGTSPTCQYTLPSPFESKDDFPLRKTASEPNLKVRSRLKQKVAERRSSPMLKRRDGNIMTPYKKRALELMDSTPTNSAPGSGPSSPIGASSALGAENGPSSLPTTTKTERWPSQPRLFRPEGSVSMLSLYTSPSLPNISLGLSTASSPISAGIGLADRSTEVKHGLPSQLLGPVPLQTGLESKLLSKSIEQLRQPSAHLQESEEEQEEQHRELTESMQEDRLPPGGVIRKHTLSSSSSNGSSGELPDAHYGVIRVKEEPADSEDEALTNPGLEPEQSNYLHQVKGRLVIRAMI
ncbi:Histone deacetylase 9-B [Liparis tanakae]|uniref:histone deacetylase n=1 Tax=Liparis tanakae TaxID=230148 RepID=A0A4Z2IKU9_9TELE|nr:Histone deacetylase 9-B [Liparis tanakae]